MARCQLSISRRALYHDPAYGPDLPRSHRRCWWLTGDIGHRVRPGGSAERLFGEVPEYQGVRHLDEATAFADPSELYRRQPEGFGELGDMGAGLGRVGAVP